MTIIWRMIYGSCVGCGRFGDITTKHGFCLWCLAKCRAKVR